VHLRAHPEPEPWLSIPRNDAGKAIQTRRQEQWRRRRVRIHHGGSFVGSGARLASGDIASGGTELAKSIGKYHTDGAAEGYIEIVIYERGMEDKWVGQ
jgi:hypothetical protein